MNRSQRAARKGSGSAQNGQQGLTLIEILVAMGILAAVAVTFLLGMSTSSKAVMVSQERVAVDSLGKSQMEYVKSSAYDETNNPPVYGIDPNLILPPGYSVLTAAARINADPGNDPNEDDGIQRITVTVTHDGETAFTVVGYKVRRAR